MRSSSRTRLAGTVRRRAGGTAYHLEAAIAAVHASAHSVEEMDWAAVVSLYDRLMAVAPSPVVALNRAIAVGSSAIRSCLLRSASSSPVAGTARRRGSTSPPRSGWRETRRSDGFSRNACAPASLGRTWKTGGRYRPPIRRSYAGACPFSRPPATTTGSSRSTLRGAKAQMMLLALLSRTHAATCASCAFS